MNQERNNEFEDKLDRDIGIKEEYLDHITIIYYLLLVVSYNFSYFI